MNLSRSIALHFTWTGLAGAGPSLIPLFVLLDQATSAHAPLEGLAIGLGLTSLLLGYALLVGYTLLVVGKARRLAPLIWSLTIALNLGWAALMMACAAGDGFLALVCALPCMFTLVQAGLAFVALGVTTGMIRTQARDRASRRVVRASLRSRRWVGGE
jgi:hypothetical protein